MPEDFEKRDKNLYEMLPDIRDSAGKPESERLSMLYEDIVRFFKKHFTDKEPDRELISDLEFLIRHTGSSEEPPPAWLTYDYVQNKFQGWIDYIKEPNYGNGPIDSGPESK